MKKAEMFHQKQRVIKKDSFTLGVMAIIFKTDSIVKRTVKIVLT